MFFNLIEIDLYKRKEPEKKAKKLFCSGFHCVDSVLRAVAEHTEIHSPLIPKIATGFYGGVPRARGLCGAVSGHWEPQKHISMRHYHIVLDFKWLKAKSRSIERTLLILVIYAEAKILDL